MDEVKKVKALKQLLDDGVITAEDFQKQKAKILHVNDVDEEEFFEEEVTAKSTSKKKVTSLEEYEQKLLKVTKVEQHNETAEDTKAKAKANDDLYEKERLKVKARLDAEAEARKRSRAETKAAVSKGVDKTKRFFKWTLAIFLWMFGVEAFFSNQGILCIPIGIIALLQGFMACPKITDYTSAKWSLYTRCKTFIVIISIMALFALSAMTNAQ